MSRLARACTLGIIACVACTRYGSIDRSKGYTGSQATVSVEDVPVTGHHVVIDATGENVSGELLGVDEEYVYVLVNDRENTTAAIARREIESMSIKLYDSGAGGAAAWTALGTVSTLSHGFWLLVSANVWLGAGIGTTASMAATNKLHVDPDQLDPLYQFSRFPQGLPRSWPGNRAPASPGESELERAFKANERRVRAIDAGSDGEARDAAGE